MDIVKGNGKGKTRRLHIIRHKVYDKNLSKLSGQCLPRFVQWKGIRATTTETAGTKIRNGTYAIIIYTYKSIKKEI